MKKNLVIFLIFLGMITGLVFGDNVRYGQLVYIENIHLKKYLTCLNQKLTAFKAEESQPGAFEISSNEGKTGDVCFGDVVDFKMVSTLKFIGKLDETKLIYAKKRTLLGCIGLEAAKFKIMPPAGPRIDGKPVTYGLSVVLQVEPVEKEAEFLRLNVDNAKNPEIFISD